MRTFLISAVLALSTLFLPARAAEPDIDAIIQKMDDLYRSNSSHAHMEMQVVTAHWQRTLTMEAWTEGTDKTFIRVLSPQKEQGVGTLRLSREMWNYLPKVNKVVKVPPSMMASSWMGSDFTNDDLVSEVTLKEDYDVTFTTVDAPEAGTLYLKAVPHEGVPVVWGYYILAVTDKDYLPVWEKYYDDKGRLMRTARFSGVKTFSKRTLPTVMEMIPEGEDKKGNKTVITYTDIEFDVPIGADVFTLRNLRSPK